MDIPRNWRLKPQRFRLEGTKCSNCGELSFPPRMICSSCRNKEHESFQFSGKGQVYSYSTVYQAPAGFEAYVPYIVALVDLEEGPRVTAQLTDVSPEDVKIGMTVQKVTRKISEEGERGMIVYGYKFRPEI